MLNGAVADRRWRRWSSRVRERASVSVILSDDWRCSLASNCQATSLTSGSEGDE